MQIGGDQTPRDRTILNCFRGYERGKLNVFDVLPSEGSGTAATEEMIDVVRLLIEDDQRITYEQIECSWNISLTAVYSVL